MSLNYSVQTCEEATLNLPGLVGSFNPQAEGTTFLLSEWEENRGGE